MPNLVRHDARPAQDAIAAAIPVPNLVLPGPSKTGTTSLFWYLAQHREVCRSSTKETLHFTPLSETEADADGRLPSLADYRGYFLHYAGERYLMESSPRYFHGGSRLAAGLAATLPDVRVLVTLRDPVTRTWSLFRYAKSRFFVPAEQTFEEYVEHCAALDAAGEPQTAVNRPYWSFPGGRYADYLPAWLEALPPDRVRVVFFEQMVRDVPGTLRGICRWLGIDAGQVADWDLTAQNRSNQYRHGTLQRLAVAANHERLLRNHPRLKRPLRAAYYAVNGGRRERPMRLETRRRLERTFADPNRRLRAQLVGLGYTDLPEWLEV